MKVKFVGAISSAAVVVAALAAGGCSHNGTVNTVTGPVQHVVGPNDPNLSPAAREMVARQIASSERAAKMAYENRIPETAVGRTDGR